MEFIANTNSKWGIKEYNVLLERHQDQRSSSREDQHKTAYDIKAPPLAGHSSAPSRCRRWPRRAVKDCSDLCQPRMLVIHSTAMTAKTIPKAGQT